MSTSGQRAKSNFKLFSWSSIVILVVFIVIGIVLIGASKNSETADQKDLLEIVGGVFIAAGIIIPLILFAIDLKST